MGRKLDIDLKSTNFKGKQSNALQLAILRESFGREKEERKPELAAETKLAEEEAKLRKPREILLTNMKRMKDLADAVPAGKSGIDRFVAGGKAQVGSFMQTLPQLNTYNRFKDVILGSVVQTVGSETSSRLSDQDIERMKGAFPKLPFDSDVQRSLSWSTFFDTVNDVAQQYGAQPIDKSQFLNESDISLLKNVKGSSEFKGSSNIESIKSRIKAKYGSSR